MAQELKARTRSKPPKSRVGSMKSASSCKTNFSSASQRLNEARLAEAKAVMIQQQAEERRKRKLEVETKRMELEIKQKEFELKQKLEIAALEAEDDIAVARSNAELASLEAKIVAEEFANSQVLVKPPPCKS